MTPLLKDALEDRARRAGEAPVDLAAIVAQGDRRRRRTRAVRAGGSLAAAAVVAALAVAALHGAPSGTSPEVADESTWSARDVSYAVGSVFHLPAADATVDVAEAVRSYVPTDDGFVWAAADGTVSFQPASGDEGERIGETSPEGRYTLANDDAGSLAAWIDFSDRQDPQLVVFDTRDGSEALRSGEDTGPGMDAMRDGADVVTVIGIDGDTVTWVNRAGVVRTDIATGDTETLGQRGALEVNDVGSGLIASDAGRPTSGPRTRVGPSLDEGRTIPHAGSATISPGGRYVSFEDADQLVVTELATGRDVQPVNPGYDYWVLTQWTGEHTFGGFGIRTVDQSGDTPALPLEMLRCAVTTGDCAVLDTLEVDPDDLALPVGESL